MGKQNKKHVNSGAKKAPEASVKHEEVDKNRLKWNASKQFSITNADLLISAGFLFWSVFCFSVFITTNKWISGAVSNPLHLHIPVVIGVLLLGWIFIHRSGSSFFVFDLKKIRGWEILLLFMLVLGMTYYSMSSGVVFDYLNISEMTIHFLLLTLQHLGFLLLFSLCGYVIGSWVLSLFVVGGTRAEQMLLRLGTGIALYGLLMVVLGYISLLYLWITIAISILILVAGYKHSRDFIHALFIKEIQIERVSVWAVIPATVSLLFIVFSVIAFTRGIPIGFDELSQYMNYPSLIAGYHSLLQGQGLMNWSVIMSLGYIWTDSKVALPSMLSSFPSILVFCSIFVLLRKRLGFSESLLGASAFLCLKVVMWQTSADAKVDLAATFFSLLLVLLVFINRTEEDHKFHKTTWLFKISERIKSFELLPAIVIGGIIAGYAFGIKYTTIFFLIAFVSLLIGKSLQSFLATLGASFIGFSIIFLSGMYALSGIDIINPADAIWMGVLLSVSGLVLLGVKSFGRYGALLKLLPSLVLFVVIVLCMNGMWFYKHYQETKSIAITDLLRGKSALVPFEEALLKGSTGLTMNTQRLLLASTSSNSDVIRNDSLRVARLKGSGKNEEVRRYLGYEPGFLKYLSVSWDTVTGKNVSTFPAYSGYLILLLLPLALFKRGEKAVNSISRVLILFILLLGSYISNYVLSQLPAEDIFKLFTESLINLNKDYESNGISSVYVSVSKFLLSFSSSFYFLWKWFIIDQPVLMIAQFMIITGVFIVSYWRSGIEISISEKLIFAAGFILLYQWIFLSSGISWYGIGAVSVLTITIFYSLFERDKGLGSIPLLRSLILVSIMMLLSISLMLRLQGVIVSYPSESKIHAMMLEYGGGELSKEEVLYDLNFALAQACIELNAHPEAGILRIGTYSQYFISNNDKRVYEDNQLDLFSKISQTSYSKQVVVNKLKKAGIQYILFDLNAGSIDNTPGRTLTSKVMMFLNFLNEYRNIKVICTDRLVEVDASDEYRNINGRNVPVKNDIYGKSIISPGSMVLLKLP